MILGQFNLIHIATFSHQIYFNMMVFYNPTDSACDCHTRGFPTKSMPLFVSFQSSWTDRKCHGLSLSYALTHTHTHSFTLQKDITGLWLNALSLSANGHWPRKHLHVSCTSYLRSSYIPSGWSKTFGEGSHQNVNIIWITAIIIQYASAILTYSSNAMGLI